MDLPKSPREWIVDGSKFVIRLPLLFRSYAISHPIKLSPLSVEINITDRCNFRCQHCRGTVADYKPKEELDFVTMQKIIDGMSEMKIPYLTLCGGEPMLRYDFVLNTIEYARHADIRVGLVTNGSLLDGDSLRKLVQTGMHRIAFSLDGATPDIHDKIRMPGSFNKIITNLEECKQLRLNYNFRIHLYTVVMKPNFEQLLDMAEIADNYNAAIFFQPVSIPQVFDQRNGKLNPLTGVSDLVVGKEDIESLKNQIRNLIELKRCRGVVGNLMWQLNNIIAYYENLQNNKPPIQFKCYAGFNSIRIDSDGAISSCMFLPAVDNIENSDLNQIWLSEGYDSHRRMIKQCTRPCAMNCYYPVSLVSLTREFVLLPIGQKTRALFRKHRTHN